LNRANPSILANLATIPMAMGDSESQWQYIDQKTVGRFVFGWQITGAA